MAGGFFQVRRKYKPSRAREGGNPCCARAGKRKLKPPPEASSNPPDGRTPEAGRSAAAKVWWEHCRFRKRFSSWLCGCAHTSPRTRWPLSPPRGPRTRVHPSRAIGTRAWTLGPGTTRAQRTVDEHTESLHTHNAPKVNAKWKDPQAPVTGSWVGRKRVRSMQENPCVSVASGERCLCRVLGGDPPPPRASQPPCSVPRCSRS